MMESYQIIIIDTSSSTMFLAPLESSHVKRFTSETQLEPDVSLCPAASLLVEHRREGVSSLR